MSSNTKHAIDICMLTVGTAYSLENIETTLGIIILVIQFIWLITKLVVKIVSSIKNKKLDEITDDDINTITGFIEDVKEKISDEQEENNGDGKQQK